MSRLWMIAYDITDNRRRQNIAKLLENYGKRVQYSVFECHLKDSMFDEMMNKLVVFMEDSDSLRCYPFCKWCGEEVFWQGNGQPVEDERFYML